jgi:SAM-dependent methyltransferase
MRARLSGWVEVVVRDSVVPVTRPGFEERRLSFGAEARSYADHRPGYPDAAIDWVMGGAEGAVRTVADVGAGAGALTDSLRRRGLDVAAFDADAAMLAELERRVPGVPTTVSPAESLPLEDDSVDAVLVAQAWHWFDKPAAAAEFVRVVRPGGVIGLLWNVRDSRVPWMGELSELIDGEDSMRASRSAARAEIEAVHNGVESHEFPHVDPRTVEALVGLLSTFSYVRLRPDRDTVYDAVRQLLATHPDTAGRESVDVPYVTASYRIPVPSAEDLAVH